MYYKNNHCIGIRDKVGKDGGKGKQIMSFGGKWCKASEEELRELGYQVCKKLAEGWSIQGTNHWARESIA